VEHVKQSNGYVYFICYLNWSYSGEMSMIESKPAYRIRDWQFFIQGSLGSGHHIRVIIKAYNSFEAAEMAKAMYGDKILSGPCGLN